MKRGTTLALFFVASALGLTGCVGDSLTGPSYRVADASEARAPLFSIQRGESRVFVLNTQLRSVEQENPSQARGHFQLKLRQVSGVDPEPFYEVAWKGKLFNPAGETFTSGAVEAVTPDDSRPLLVLFEGQRARGPKIDIAGRAMLPGAQAEAILAQPEVFQVLLRTTAQPEGAIWGIFGGVDPEPF